MALSGKDQPREHGQERKTLADKFEAESRPLIQAAERGMQGLTSIGELMASMGKRPFLEVISESGAEKRAWETLSKSKFASLLRLASSKRDSEASEAFKYLLYKLLKQWEIDPPARAFTRMQAMPGAPVKRKTQEVRARWEQDGKPSITSELCLAYAKRFYTSEYSKAKGPLSQRKLIARVRTPLLKHQKALSATNSPSRNS